MLLKNSDAAAPTRAAPALGLLRGRVLKGGIVFLIVVATVFMWIAFPGYTPLHALRAIPGVSGLGLLPPLPSSSWEAVMEFHFPNHVPDLVIRTNADTTVEKSSPTKFGSHHYVKMNYMSNGLVRFDLSPYAEQMHGVGVAQAYLVMNADYNYQYDMLQRGRVRIRAARVPGLEWDETTTMKQAHCCGPKSLNNLFSGVDFAHVAHILPNEMRVIMDVTSAVNDELLECPSSLQQPDAPVTLNLALSASPKALVCSKEAISWCGFEPSLVIYLRGNSPSPVSIDVPKAFTSSSPSTFPMLDHEHPYWSVNISTKSETTCSIPDLSPSPSYMDIDEFKGCAPLVQFAHATGGKLSLRRCSDGSPGTTPGTSASLYYSTEPFDTKLNLRKWVKLASTSPGSGDTILFEHEFAIVCCSSTAGPNEKPFDFETSLTWTCNFVNQVIRQEGENNNSAASGSSGQSSLHHPEESGTDLRFRVSMAMIDSLSRAHFFRAMSGTTGLLKQLRGGDESIQGAAGTEVFSFHRYMTVGLSTHGNLVPLLAGSTHRPHQKLDLWVPEIARRNGFVTMVAEQNCPNENSLVNGNIEWTHRSASVHCGNPLLWSKTRASLKQGRPYCVLGSRRVAQAVDYMEDFQRQYASVSTSTLSISMFQDAHMPSESFVRTIDKDIQRWVRVALGLGSDASMASSTACSVALLFSDHGSRQFGYPQTHAGYLEEKLPLLIVGLSPQCKTQMPWLVEALSVNQDRIVTALDLYQTLHHIVSIASAATAGVSVSHPIKVPPNKRVKHPVYSLFEEIPLSRTWKTAGVQARFSPCLGWERLACSANMLSIARVLAMDLLCIVNRLIGTSEVPCLYDFGTNSSSSEGERPLGRGSTVVPTEGERFCPILRLGSVVGARKNSDGEVEITFNAGHGAQFKATLGASASGLDRLEALMEQERQSVSGSTLSHAALSHLGSLFVDVPTQVISGGERFHPIGKAKTGSDIPVFKVLSFYQTSPYQQNDVCAADMVHLQFCVCA